jgi:3-deoxy-D-manno-octulosonic-acid transferase
MAPPVLLLDTLGELAACWGLADVAFVGGSLTRRGGQNMLEPAAYGAAVLFGPNTWNFRDIVEQLLARQAARVVRSAAELTCAVRELLSDRGAAAELGSRARAFVATQQGATSRTIELLLPQPSEVTDAAAKAKRSIQAA